MFPHTRNHALNKRIPPAYNEKLFDLAGAADYNVILYYFAPFGN